MRVTKASRNLRFSIQASQRASLPLSYSIQKLWIPHLHCTHQLFVIPKLWVSKKLMLYQITKLKLNYLCKSWIWR
uniref:Uncharacterized protein n=1 Tax=Solanum tuberosum TaxID=4113 RepID=M1AYH4_SOLTU